MSDIPSQQDAPALTGGVEDYVNPRALWIDASGPNGERDPRALPLYEAIFAHDAARVKTLLAERRSSPDLPLYPGRESPLTTAIALNDLNMVKVLLEAGADINLVSGVERPVTPLAAALDYGRFYSLEKPTFAVFRYLINNGADVNIVFGGRRDIAFDTATFGRMHLTNMVLDHGYNRDLPGLKRVLENRVVIDSELEEKNRAIARIDGILNKATIK